MSQIPFLELYSSMPKSETYFLGFLEINMDHVYKLFFGSLGPTPFIT